MRESETLDFLSRYSKARHPPRWSPQTATLLAMTLGAGLCAGIILGWYLHNTYWRKAELDYTLSRALTHLATCKGLPRSEIVIRIEQHINRPMVFFQLDDKLVALDFIFDRIEARHCINRILPPPLTR